MNTQRRADILLAPAFVASVLVLIINDHLLKPAHSNWFTGKLSDFSGLFAVVALVAAIAPSARYPSAALVASAFAFWKSSASESMIQLWNGLAWWPVSRTVDPTDLMALAVVPFAVAYATRYKSLRLRPDWWRSPAKLAMGLLAFIASAATSYRSPVDFNITYSFDGPPDLLVRQLEANGLKVHQEGSSNRYELWIPADFCFDYVFADITITPTGAQTLLVLERITHHCPRKHGEKDDLQLIFDTTVVAPAHLRRVA